MTPQLCRLVAGVVLAGLIVSVWANSAALQPPQQSDATHEWLLLKATLSGVSPNLDVADLAKKFDVPYSGTLTNKSTKVVAYRTPGALLLASPLLLGNWPEAHTVVSVVGVTAFLWLMLGLIPRLCDRPAFGLVVPLGIAVFSVSFREATRWGSVLTATAVCATLVLIKPTQASSGIPLGIATMLKAYPGIMFVPLLIHRNGRRTAWTAAATSLILTVAGLGVLGVSLLDTIQAFDEGSKPWLLYEFNISLGALVGRATQSAHAILWIALAGLAFAVIYSLRRPLVQSLAFGLCLALLVSPVSWISYGVLLIPLVVWLWANYQGFRIGSYAAATWLLVEAFAVRISELASEGTARASVLAARVLVTIAIGIAPPGLWAKAPWDPPPDP